MWDDIIIGKGEKGNSAVKVFGVPGDHRISHNRVSFWISGCYLDVDVTIFKDTKEGQTLQRMIDDCAALEEIQTWLDDLVLRCLDPKRLKLRIEQAMEKAFEAGQCAKAAEIRAALAC